jgi:hypothetical protein
VTEIEAVGSPSVIQENLLGIHENSWFGGGYRQMARREKSSPFKTKRLNLAYAHSLHAIAP